MWSWFGDWIARRKRQREMERKGQLGTRKRRTESLWTAAADRSPVLMLLMALILWVICVAVLTLPALRPRPQLVPHQLAPATIFARTDFSYEDKAATARLREEATLKQARYYRIATPRNEQIRRNLDAFFAAAQRRAELEEDGRVYVAPELAIDQALAALSPSAFQIVAHLDDDQLLKDEFIRELNALLAGGIIDDTEASAMPEDLPVRIIDAVGRDRQARPRREVVACTQAIDNLTALLLSYRPEIRAVQLDREALSRLVGALFDRRGNLELDSERTIARRDAAIAAVKPAMVEVKKNEVIVRRNQLVSSRILDELAAQDAVIDSHNQDNDRVQRFFQHTFWSMILILLAGFYLVHIHPEIMRSSRQVALIVTVAAMALIINYLAMEVFYFFSGVLAIPPELVADALPLALPAVLLAVTAGYRVSLYVGFFVAMVSALMLEGSFNVALEGLVLSSLVGLTVRRAGNYRAFFTRTFCSVFVTVWLLDFDLFWHITAAPRVLFFTGALAFGNALFTAVTALLLTFLFELLFNVITNMSLMVLCDFNHPLLKELHLKAPGTSQHSQNVAMLAENAATDIGANPARARAGALFHDIGKLKNPEYFVENNFNGVNHHANLSPRMSSIIISNHVKDGLDLALSHKLCRIVRDMIQRHHGTDLIQFFYRLALQGENPVVESDYRYPGPLPHTREEVIVSLADACEAACRSLEKPTASKIEAMVNEIFRKRWRDGQLDDADLTIEELSRINESFVRTLTTMYHGRIAYPRDEENEDENDLFLAERPAPGAGPKAAQKSDV